jgi:NADPH:quinone reductase-like Zn-dependent oxidoreductase
MSKVVRFHSLGEAEVLQIDDIPTKEPGPGEARVRIKATGINRDQFTLMKGQHFRLFGWNK